MGELIGVLMHVATNTFICTFLQRPAYSLHLENHWYISLVTFLPKNTLHNCALVRFTQFLKTQSCQKSANQLRWRSINAPGKKSGWSPAKNPTRISLLLPTEQWLIRSSLLIGAERKLRNKTDLNHIDLIYRQLFLLLLTDKEAIWYVECRMENFGIRYENTFCLPLLKRISGAYGL